jgi:FkbM family methyltransferase
MKKLLMRRSFLLARRSFIAARLGFAFFGTTKTPFPKTVRLCGMKRGLSAPKEPGVFEDVINVWLDDEYGLGSIACPPKTILDIGGNVGVFSLWAAHRFPGARIHAYEPNPRLIQFLQPNLHDLPVEIFCAGLGAKQGKACMKDSGESRLASTLPRADGEIEIAPLAEAINRLGGSVDLMKIDCEGAEWDLFEDRASFRRVKEIRMEYHLKEGHSLDEFKAKVRELGFSILKLKLNQGFGLAWLQRAGD